MAKGFRGRRPIGKFLFLLMMCNGVSTSQTLEITEHLVKPQMRHACSKPTQTLEIDAKIPEGSGLIAWNDWLWTHNDSGAPKLFALDASTGKIVGNYLLPEVENRDWEDIGQDTIYFYVGDFGNNFGERDTLQVLRIEKKSLLEQRPVIVKITFSWPATIRKGKREKINFNCEAMVVANDSIYLFTKEWKHGRRTRVFSLPAKPGNYEATYRSTLKTPVLITGANYNPGNRSLVLCGYNLWARPFLLQFDGVKDIGNFSGKGRKIKVRKRFRQVEGVATFDGTNYFIINEDLKFWFLHTSQQLHRLELECPK